MHFFVRPDCPNDLLEPIRTNKVADWGQYMTNYPEEHDRLSRFLWCDVQEFFCAYCERVIPPREGENYGKGHIEHLERISDNGNRMGDWNNLFFSCNDMNSCGHYKDSKGQRFNIDDIIDPAKEDPLAYFRYDANGGIQPIESDREHPHKASETIRIFNLDKAASLRATRKAIAETVAAFINGCGGFPTEQEVADFLDSVQSQDCPSVYKSMLSSNSRSQSSVTTSNIGT